MPTNHRRIAVTEDEQLAGALDRVRPLLDGHRSRASLVRELALRGAERVLEEEERRKKSIEALIEWSTNMPDGQREILLDIDRLTRGADDAQA
jgi:hypothetical protein